MTKIFFLLTVLCANLYQLPTNHASQEEEIYIYEAAPKINGQGVLGFIIVHDKLIVKRISYKIHFTSNRVISIDKAVHSETHGYSKNLDGNITIDGLHLTAYSGKGFSNHPRLNKMALYQLLGSNFLDNDNYEKMKILDQLMNNLEN